METEDRWRREVEAALGAGALNQPGADQLLAAVNRYADKYGLSPEVPIDQESIRDLAWFYREATTGVRPPPEPKGTVSRSGARQRHEAAEAELLRELRKREDLIAFRATWDLPKKIDAIDEPARSDEVVQTLASLPEGALEGLRSVAKEVRRATDWSADWCYRFVVFDEAPAPHLEGSPALMFFRAVTAEDIYRSQFAGDRRERGEKWKDICAAWDREQRRANRPQECYGKNWRQLQRDVGRTDKAAFRQVVRESALNRLGGRILSRVGGLGPSRAELILEEAKRAVRADKRKLRKQRAKTGEQPGRGQGQVA